ncbi:MAG: tRNA (adenosine(37)-N6)-threonylcarbamoyltransferase complex transferase subunit TsaD [Chitinophagales bacterium]|nr:tRNA (adenosine(37)-N6)-threonylcarbamoyltransferase complex transferase subunit TsaD [Chitinophagales bacterium]
MPVNILAIESSCDETAAAVIQNGKILSNVIASQQEHNQYGGVVPELASRVHVQKIIPVVHEALLKADITTNKLSAIAFTAGPGLIGSLMVGSSFAKAMAMALNVPVIGVHHMQAHIHAHFISNSIPAFPFLCLTVSGGHTQIVLVKGYLEMKIVGETIDDAAGEAFDKTAKLLKLPYPGGPLIDRYAKLGNANAFDFPEPKIKDFDFSFSGLKTSILYFLKEKEKENKNFIQERLNDICASVQSRIVSILLNKLKRAAEEFEIKEIALAGGVSSNSLLRNEAQKIADKKGWNLYLPMYEFCTDNAAMIASVAYHKYLENKFDTLSIAPQPRIVW